LSKARFSEAVMSKDRLTPRHQRFVAQYLIDLNGSQAAIRAGYAPRSAARYGVKLLRHPGIAAAVSQELAAREEKARITGDRVLQEYGRMAFANMRDFADWGRNGVTLREQSDLSEADAAAVAEILPSDANGKGGKIKLYDKKAALDALARHLGLFDPRSQLGKEDRTAGGKDARKELRERIQKLMRKGGS
jgi:phage terminase small subunit